MFKSCYVLLITDFFVLTSTGYALFIYFYTSKFLKYHMFNFNLDANEFQI